MSLISIDNFSKVFLPFTGRKVCLVNNPGNVGDQMIFDSCIQLLDYFKIKYCWTVLEMTYTLNFKRLDAILICGGGNMGSRFDWQEKILLHKKYLLEQKCPVTVLPQSYTDSPDLDGYEKVWVREVESLKWNRLAALAPELALGYETKREYSSATEKIGIFIREDYEASESVYKEKSLGDPTLLCRTVDEYLLLASNFEEIITNRLHFAIAGLIVKRKVNLLKNSYYKNKSVYDCWLKNLGCNWI